MFVLCTCSIDIIHCRHIIYTNDIWGSVNLPLNDLSCSIFILLSPYRYLSIPSIPLSFTLIFVLKGFIMCSIFTGGWATFKDEIRFLSERYYDIVTSSLAFCFVLLRFLSCQRVRGSKYNSDWIFVY